MCPRSPVIGKLDYQSIRAPKLPRSCAFCTDGVVVVEKLDFCSTSIGAATLPIAAVKWFGASAWTLGAEAEYQGPRRVVDGVHADDTSSLVDHIVANWGWASKLVPWHGPTHPCA